MTNKTPQTNTAHSENPNIRTLDELGYPNKIKIPTT